jgi:hypothetical protein
MFRIADKLVKKVSPSRLDPMGLGQTYWKFWRSIMKNPGNLMARNIQLAAEQLKLLTYGVKKPRGRMSRKSSHLEKAIAVLQIRTGANSLSSTCSNRAIC